MSKYTIKDTGLLIEFFVKPNCRNCELVIEKDCLYLRINAPPIKGKANKTIIEFLSRYFDIPKSSISIAGGIKSKSKSIYLADLTEHQKSRIIEMIKK